MTGATPARTGAATNITDTKSLGRSNDENAQDPALFDVVITRTDAGTKPMFVATSSLPGADLPTRDEWWISTGLQAVAAMARSTTEAFTAFDVAEKYQLVEPSSSALWGALMFAAKKQGIVVPAGYARSRRPDAHGALCRTWVGAR